MCKCEEIYKGDRVLQRGGKIMSKKVLAFLLTLCLAIGCVPIWAFAANTIGENVLTVKKKGDGEYQAILTMDKDYTNGKASALQMSFTFDKDVLSVTGSSLKIGDTECSGTGINITDDGKANEKGEIIAAISTKCTPESEVDITGDIQLIVNMKLKAGKSVGNIAKDFKVSYYELHETAGGDQVLVVGTTTNAEQPNKYELNIEANGKVAVQDIINAEGSYVINGNVLSTTTPGMYDIAILYVNEAVYTYIPEDAQDDDINGIYQNPESSVTAENPTAKDIKGKWCGYGGAGGFDGNQNRITIINGTTVASKITATAEKNSEIEMSDSFKIDVKSIAQAQGNYEILSKACNPNGGGLDEAFDACKVAGKKFGDAGSADIAIAARTNSSISYVNLYYNLTGNPGKDVAKYGGEKTPLGTITITVKAA